MVAKIYDSRLAATKFKDTIWHFEATRKNN